MNRAGLTLLELVVALTVTAIALAAGYGAFTTIIDQRDRLTIATDDIARTAGVRRMLNQWLSGARVGVGGDGPSFSGLDGVAGNNADDELTFLTESRTPLGDVPTIVRVFVDRDPVTPETGLTAALIEWRGTLAKSVQLASEVEGLDVRYLSNVIGGRRWLPSWISRTVLPRGIEITLIPTAGDSLPALLALPLTVAIAGGT